MPNTRVFGSSVRLTAVGVAAATLALNAAIASAVDITDCGQTVPPHKTGVLVSNLDCSLSYGTYAVILSSGARLKLNGFTLRSSADGVDCLGQCRIKGPGEVARTEPSCSGNTVIDTYGVFGDGSVALDSVTFTSWGYATWGSLRLTAKRVQVIGQCSGMIGNYRRISVFDSTITDNLG